MGLAPAGDASPEQLLIAVRATDAFAAGCSVPVFSDGVPGEHEVAPKRAAHDAGVAGGPRRLLTGAPRLLPVGRVRS